jgi:hypothetical protein
MITELELKLSFSICLSLWESKFGIWTDFCFAAADSQNVWESVPFLAVWQGAPPIIYKIRRVDATSFRSLFLIISTLVVGESWRLAPYQFGGKYTDDVWVERPEKTYDSLGM